MHNSLLILYYWVAGVDEGISGVIEEEFDNTKLRRFIIKPFSSVLKSISYGQRTNKQHLILMILLIT